MGRKKGFTLIEVVVSLALLMIIIAIVMTAMSLYGRVNASASKQLRVQQIAVNAIEEIAYTAKEHSKNRGELIIQLEASDKFGAFHVTGDTYTLSKEDYKITLTFSNSDRVVKIRVEIDSQQYFETLEWLTYGTT